MSSKPIITRHRADDDIERAFEYYLIDAGPDLAEAFINEFEYATSHLSRFPMSGSPRFEHALAIPGLRQWPFQRFPYLILYLNQEHHLEVWRVLHGQADIPAWMRDEE